MNKRQKSWAQFVVPRGNAVKLFAVIEEPIMAITVTAHLTYYLLTMGLGMLGLWQGGGSFGHPERALTRWSAGAMALRQKACLRLEEGRCNTL